MGIHAYGYTGLWEYMSMGIQVYGYTGLWVYMSMGIHVYGYTCRLQHTVVGIGLDWRIDGSVHGQGHTAAVRVCRRVYTCVHRHL